MRSQCLLVLSLLFSSVAPALPILSLPKGASFFQKTNFVEAQRGLLELGLPISILSATPSLQVLDDKGRFFSNCGGTVVSENGTVLTGGHCIKVCLAGKALVNIDGLQAVDHDRLSQVRCNLKINGQLVQAQVLATNDCRGEEDRFKKSTARVICDGLDYAVLKIEPKENPGLPCLPVGDRRPVTGTRVAAISSPPRTSRHVKRPGALNSSGEGLHLSSGEIRDFDGKCLPLLPGSKKPIDMYTPDQLPIVMQQAAAGHLLKTTTDVLKEVSGAGLMDWQNGVVIGIARSSNQNTTITECEGSGIYSSMASVLAAIRRDFPQVNVEETFRCGKNAFQNDTPATPGAGTSPPAQGTPDATR